MAHAMLRFRVKRDNKFPELVHSLFGQRMLHPGKAVQSPHEVLQVEGALLLMLLGLVDAARQNRKSDLRDGSYRLRINRPGWGAPLDVLLTRHESEQYGKGVGQIDSRRGGDGGRSTNTLLGPCNI